VLRSNEEPSHICGILWPVRSPDFFQWGCLKERVHNRGAESDIRHEIATYVKSCWVELLAVLTVLQFDDIRQCVANEGGRL